MSKKGSKVAKEECHFFSAQTLSAGAQQLQLTPSSMGTSIQSVSDGFALFRIRSLRFRIFAFTGGCAAGVITSNPNAGPTGSRAILMELPDAVNHEASLQTVPTEWIHVRKATVAGPFEWYHTRAGTYDVTEYVPCTMFFVGSGTNVVNVEIRCMFEFKDPVPTSSTPMAVTLRKQIRLAEDEEVVRAVRERTLRGLLGLKSSDPIPPSVLQLGILAPNGMLKSMSP